MIYTVHARDDDMTFIMQEEDNKLSAVGFHFGESDEEGTKTYAGNLTAEFETVTGE